MVIIARDTTGLFKMKVDSVNIAFQNDKAYFANDGKECSIPIYMIDTISELNEDEINI